MSTKDIKLAPVGTCAAGKTLKPVSINMQMKYCRNMGGKADIPSADETSFVVCDFDWCIEGGIYSPSGDAKMQL